MLLLNEYALHTHKYISHLFSVTQACATTQRTPYVYGKHCYEILKAMTQTQLSLQILAVTPSVTTCIHWLKPKIENNVAVFSYNFP